MRCPKAVRRAARGGPFLVALALVGGALGACARREPQDDAPPPSLPECDAYAEAFARCMELRGAADTTAAAREAVAARFARAATADEATRARFREQCAEGQKTLAAGCR